MVVLGVAKGVVLGALFVWLCGTGWLLVVRGHGGAPGAARGASPKAVPCGEEDDRERSVCSSLSSPRDDNRSVWELKM